MGRILVADFRAERSAADELGVVNTLDLGKRANVRVEQAMGISRCILDDHLRVEPLCLGERAKLENATFQGLRRQEYGDRVGARSVHRPVRSNPSPKCLLASRSCATGTRPTGSRG